jgi:LexA-binding, inner membrane-associated putative hydrolase
MQPDHAWPFLAAPSHPVLSALWEVFAHGLLAVIVILPLAWRSSRRTGLVLLAFIGGIGLDVDHAVAAGSFDPRSMEQLGQRPDTHSLLFVSALALAALVVTRRKPVAWAVFAVLVAHLLFDAPGGGVRWLFPLQNPTAIPWLVCPVGIVLLTGISLIVSRAGVSKRPRSSPRSLPDSNPVDEHARREVGGSVG